MNLHEACYQGSTNVVAQLLASGANPNEPADPTEREWISRAGSRPRPLNCVTIAWTITENHVEIARLLIEHGAGVDDPVLEDHTIETVRGTADSALWYRIATHGLAVEPAFNFRWSWSSGTVAGRSAARGAG